MRLHVHVCPAFEYVLHGLSVDIYMCIYTVCSSFVSVDNFLGVKLRILPIVYL